MMQIQTQEMPHDGHYGFGMVPRLVMRHPRFAALPESAKWLYTCLKDICGESEKGECFYSLRNLKELIHMSVSTLSRGIRKLVEAGLIQAAKLGPKGREIFHIKVVNIWAENDTTYQDCFKKKQSDQGTVSKRQGSVSNCNTPTSKRNSDESNHAQDCFNLTYKGGGEEEDSSRKDSLKCDGPLSSYETGLGPLSQQQTHRDNETISQLPIVNMTTGSSYSEEEQSLDFSIDGSNEVTQEVAELNTFFADRGGSYEPEHDEEETLEQMSTHVEKQASAVDNAEQASAVDKEVTQEPPSRVNTNLWQEEGAKPASEAVRTVAQKDAELIAEEVKATFAAPAMATVPPLPVRAPVAPVVKKSTEREEAPTPLECPDMSGPLSKEAILAYFDYQRGYKRPVLFSPSKSKRKTPYESAVDCAYALWQLCLRRGFDLSKPDAVYRYMSGADKDTTGIYDAWWYDKHVDIEQVLQNMDCKLREIERKKADAKPVEEDVYVAHMLKIAAANKLRYAEVSA